jgi:deoxyribodipyrimidine photo-lyase
MTTSYDAGLVWLRRDLRVEDQAALSRALAACRQVHLAFLFDRAILDPLPRADRRVEFIRESLSALDAQLQALGPPGAGLIVVHGTAEAEVPRLAQAVGARAVFANEDYEPAAIARDDAVRTALAARGIALHLSPDQALLAPREVLSQAGTPYTVFTPYFRAWSAKLDEDDVRDRSSAELGTRLAPRPPALREGVPALADLGFEPTDLAALPIATGSAGAAATLQDFADRIDRYESARDFPALKGPSYLGVHLRFGTVSVRALARLARARAGPGAATWLKELAWRDFYFQVLAHFPHVHDAAGVSHSFRPEYDRIAWEEGPQAEARWRAWCEGRTGYPIVDAAMLQLERTGYMHNRLRMVAASFLCKHLGIDWRRGEAWFARKLNDFDLAANNGGWQWASSSGCDAQPYFRIFNPVLQGQRFDAEGKFVLRYLPQLANVPAKARHAPWQAGGAPGYPPPIVDHAQARAEALRRYAVVKG